MKHIKDELTKLVRLITKKERVKNPKVNELATELEMITSDELKWRGPIVDGDYLGINSDPEFVLAR